MKLQTQGFRVGFSDGWLAVLGSTQCKGLGYSV